jgi:hypothetical protein
MFPIPQQCPASTGQNTPHGQQAAPAPVLLLVTSWDSPACIGRALEGQEEGPVAQCLVG